MSRNRTPVAHQRPQQSRTIHFRSDAPIVIQPWVRHFTLRHLSQCVWNPFLFLVVADILEQASQVEDVAAGKAKEVLSFWIVGSKLAKSIREI